MRTLELVLRLLLVTAMIALTILFFAGCEVRVLVKSNVDTAVDTVAADSL